MKNGQDSVILREYQLIKAKEKCFEIQIKTAKEFEKEKEKCKLVGTKQIDLDIKKKWKDFKAEQNKQFLKDVILIFTREKSRSITQAKMDKMRVANRGVMKIFQATQEKVVRVLDRNNRDNKKHRELLRDLIVQGLVKLDEQEVIVKCLEKDKNIVRSVLGEAQKKYYNKKKKQVKLRVGTEFLRERENYKPANNMSYQSALFLCECPETEDNKYRYGDKCSEC